ncbi:MAG: hypothetical protein ABI586_03965 [Candidatus Nanopelagicales bacterium]
MNQTFSLITGLLIALTLLSAIGWLLARVVTQDRPRTPSRPYQDWREEQLNWRQLGIR